MKIQKSILIFSILISVLVLSISSSLASAKGKGEPLRSELEFNIRFDNIKTAHHVYRLLVDGFNKLIRKVKNILDLNFIEERIVNLVKVTSPKQAAKEIENVKGNNINGKEIKDVKTDIVKKRLADRDTSKNAYKLRNIVLSSSLNQDEYNENYRKKRKRDEILALGDHPKNIFENETSNINTTGKSNKGRSNKNRESTFTQEEAKNVKEIETIYVPKTIAERSINSIIGKRNVKYMGFDYPIEVSQDNLIPTTEERVIQQAEYKRKVNKLLSSDDAPIKIVTKKVIQPLSESNRSEQILDNVKNKQPSATKPAVYSYLCDRDNLPKLEYVPGEIIVKLREAGKGDIFSEKYSLREDKRREILDMIKNKYDLVEVGPAFCSLHKQLKTGDKSLLKLMGEKGTSLSQQSKRISKTADVVDLIPIYILKTHEQNTLIKCEQLRRDTDVVYAEPNYIYNAYIEPNDPYFSSSGSWGQEYEDMWGLHKVRMEYAWDIEAGETNPVVVAVIDTGIDYNHQELGGRIWQNAREVPDNDVDDDNNGYIDDYQGWNFENDSNEVLDDNGHGTHLSGTIGAVTKNNSGIAGINWGVKIMALKGLDEGGSGSLTDLVDSIFYAVDNGAQIINMSWGSYVDSSLMQDVLSYAYNSGCIPVAAMGNDGTNNRISYPAAYRETIAVAASDVNDGITSFSSRGRHADVSAPGEDILSLRAANGNDMNGHATPVNEYYLRASGTSMATPHIVGIISLLLSHYNDLTVEDVRRIVYSCCEDIEDSGWDRNSGFGRIDAFKVLDYGNQDYLLARIRSPIDGELFGKVKDIYGTAIGSDFFYYEVEVGQGKQPEEWITIGIELAGGEVVDGKLATWHTEGLADGIWTVRLVAYNNDYDRVEDSVMVTVDNSLQLSWPQNTLMGGASYNSTVVTGDIDNDGDLEIVTGSYEGLIYAWHHDGRLVNGWPQFGPGQANTPALADLDNDGDLEIIVPFAVTYYYCPDNKNFFAWHHDGTPVDGWPLQGHNYYSDAPVVVDMDGDGDLEIIIAEEDRKIHAYHHDGTEVSGWPVRLEYIQNGTAVAVGDVDNDGEIEVVAAESSAYGIEIYGDVYAWNSDGTIVNGDWPVDIDGTLYQPVLGDVDGDGSLEVIVSGSIGVCVFEGNGTVVPGWPKEQCKIISLGDMDNDGAADIVAADYNGELHLWHGDGTEFPGWPIEFGFHNPAWVSGVAIADCDNDGQQEIVVPAYDSWHGIGYLYIFNLDGSIVPGFPKTGVSYFAPPAIADIDKDGDVEIIAFGEWRGKLGVPVYVWDLNSWFSEGDADWPMYGCNYQHKGCYIASNNIEMPDLVPAGITYEREIIKTGDLVRFETGIKNIGDIDSNIFNVKWYVNGELDRIHGYGSHRGIPAQQTDMDGNSGYNWIAPEEPGKYEIKFVVDADNHIVESDEDNNKVAITVEVKSNLPPVADAGEDQIIYENDEAGIAILNGSKSYDPDGDELQYNWRQIQYPKHDSVPVQLNNPNSTNPTFEIPSVGRGIIFLRFKLTISDGEYEDVDIVNVEIWNEQYTKEYVEELDGGIWQTDHDDNGRNFEFKIVNNEENKPVYNGAESLEMWLDGTNDEGGMWIEREIDVSGYSGATIKVDVSFWFWGEYVPEDDEWAIIEMTGINNPEDPDDFMIIGAAGEVAGWYRYRYSTNIEVPENVSTIWAAIGIQANGDGEVERSYYIDAITVTISDENNPPVLEPIGDKQIKRGRILDFTVTAADYDGDILDLSVVGLPEGVSFYCISDLPIGSISYKFIWWKTVIGDYEITFTVSDRALTDSETITISVKDFSPPVLKPIGDKAVDEGGNLTFTITATDPDWTIPSLSAEDLPEEANFADNGNGIGTFSWTPSYEQSGDYSVTFIASDGRLTDSETITITVTDINRPPVADAGQDQVREEGTLVTLDGSGSYDPDEDELTYKWIGPVDIKLSDPCAVKPTFIAPDVCGRRGYGFVLEVRDPYGALSCDYVLVTVSDKNNPPVANAGQDQVVNEGDSIQLDGSGSYDPDGDPIEFFWRQISGPEVDLLPDDRAEKPTFTAPNVDQEETLCFVLTVIDEEKLYDTDMVDIYINNADNSRAIYIYDEFPNFIRADYYDGCINHGPGELYFNKLNGKTMENVYCMKIVFDRDDWSGVCFLKGDPQYEESWTGPGLDFDDCYLCKFMAKGEYGGERVKIEVNGIEVFSPPWLTLNNEWNEYEVDLSKYNLESVNNIFSIVVEGPATVYFDNIKFITRRVSDNPRDVRITGSIFDNSSKIWVDEKEFQVKGVGYDVCNSQHYQQDFPMIYNAGGNTIRTWGQNQAVFSTLDALHLNGMKILMGFWLPREKDFYTDELKKQAVRNQLKRFINTFKNHPAVLGWLVGNEVYYRLDKAGKDAFLIFLDELCLMVKNLDPNHPVGYVDAGLMPLEGLANYVPNLDFYGSNMYGYLSGSWVEDYLQYNYDKPIIFTEFGSNGPWEEPFNNNYEMFNKTYYDLDKAQWIADRWDVINDNHGLTLGGCVFAWTDCCGEDGEGLLRWGIVDNDRTPRRQFIDLAKVWDENRVRYIYVDDDSLSAGDGSQAHPFGTIQEGIDAASDYMTVAVAEGIYYENIHLKPNIWLEGGWSNGFLERNLYQYKSEIIGAGGHVVRADDNATIDGFYITGSGNASQDWYASGIWSQNKNVRISNNVLYGNNRGISCWNSSGNLVRNNILCNHQTDTIYCFSSNPAIVNNTIANNIDPMGRPTFGVFCQEVKEGARIINNIIAYNEVGISVINPLSVPYIGYNDVWGNSIMEYEGVEDLTGVEGNIHRDPLFIDPSGVPYGDFHLGDGSPCVDRGAPWSDYHNEPQPNGGRINMGVYGNTEQAETIEWKIVLEADYILACQFDPSPGDSNYNARGAINNIYAVSGEYSWIVPGENAMAILGLLRAYEVTGNSLYLDRANMCADYLDRVLQEDDESWYNQYCFDRETDNAMDARHTAEVMLAFYFLGFDENRYNSMKKGAGFLLACQKDDGLVCGGKKPDGSYHTWRWTSDNSYAYQAFGAAYNWAIQCGDKDFADRCSIARDNILNGINTHLKDPNTAVWHKAIDELGNPQASDPDWINYAPLMLDVPAVCNIQDVGTWIHNKFQQEDGSCIGNYQGAVRKYPGLTFQASLCWIDTGQLPYKNKGIEWAEDSVLWQSTEDNNHIAGGWIDWIEISPEQGKRANWWERFIDTSAYSIFVWTGGFDFDIQEEDE